MKVALAINYDYHDYGGMLQAFATQRFLTKNGIESDAINFDNLKGDINKRKWRYFLSNIFDISIVKEKSKLIEKKLKQKSNEKLKSGMAERDAAFDEFCKSHFKVSRAFESWEDMAKASRNEYDAVVVGSDQLWLPSNIMADYYTLNWVPQDVKKIAYATSFGIGSIPAKYSKIYSHYLKRINYLSARETSPPQVGKYKVYIIDEVHMLSQSAFNAFLKTLEEPPHYAIFILATTEKYKILPTILSRCQIYDFNRITVDDITGHLEYVAQKEGVNAEPEALHVIAVKADGGMRDALSIFDQTVSFTGGNVTYQHVIENLNVLDYEYYFQITDYLLKGKVCDTLLLFNEILNKGFDGNHFITGLASHFRDLLVSRDPATLILLEAGASIRQRCQQQATECPLDFLYKGMKLCNDCDLNYKNSKNKRLLVELTLIQLAQITTIGEETHGNQPDKTPVIRPITPIQAQSGMKVYRLAQGKSQ